MNKSFKKSMNIETPIIIIGIIVICFLISIGIPWWIFFFIIIFVPFI